jgi:DNA-binding transcriptional ArsR family regulator
MCSDSIDSLGSMAMSDPVLQRRRAPTVREAKALGHPLRVRILALCARHELTNKQLADRLDATPGTVLHHVRILVDAGLLQAAPVRTGASGALEKPYRSDPGIWWLDNPLGDLDADTRFTPIAAFQDELAEAGPESVQTFARFLLHLSPDEVAEFDRRILAVIDEYVTTDHERLDRPAHNGMVILHRLAGDGPAST